MENHMVSIVTPVYNGEKYLEECIQSICNQTHQNWELLLIDDNSQDASAEIIDQYARLDERIRAIKLEKNYGAAVARNTGLQEAKGRFVAFLDSDDLWKPEKLSRQLRFMKNENVGFSFTNYELINENGKKLNKVVSPVSRIDYNEMLKGNSIGCLTVIIDREIIGDFRMPLFRRGQDYATWLSLLRKGHTAHKLDENLALYRIVKNSLSGNKLIALKRTWNVYYYIEKLGLAKSCYYFIIYMNRAVLKRL